MTFLANFIIVLAVKEFWRQIGYVLAKLQQVKPGTFLGHSVTVYSAFKIKEELASKRELILNRNYPKKIKMSLILKHRSVRE